LGNYLFNKKIIKMNLNFGDAIIALKEGKKVCRSGWNGKGMFLYYVAEKVVMGESGDMVNHGAYIAMKTAQNNVVPWLASQTDVLSEDWMVIN
jgi:hypothetical protein